MTASNGKTGTVFTGVSHGVCALIGAGPRGKLAVTICQTLNIVCFCIAYTITAAVSMQEVSEHICQGPRGSCIDSTWALALIFGGLQLFFSQMPNLESSWWMSAIGATMSVGYAGIALGLCIAHAGNGHGSLGGIETTAPDKVFEIFNALGSMAFAFSFSVILLEIQDTLREPPKADKTMGKVIQLSLGISFTFYLAISIAGYLAFGNTVPGDVLTGFSGPSWLITLANCLVVVHMLSAYQVYAQPLFVLVEWEIWVRLLKHKSPKRSGPSTSSAVGPRGLSALAAAQQHTTLGQGAGPFLARAAAGAWGVTSASSVLQEEADAVTSKDLESGKLAGSPADFKLQMSPCEGHDAHSTLPDEAAMRRLQAEEAEGDEEQPPALSPNLSVRCSVQDIRCHASPGPLWLRLLWRSAYVAFTTIIAMVLPFFQNFVGLIGGLMFWPLSIGFPLGMWLVVCRPSGWKKYGALVVAVVMLCVGLAAIIGSTRNIIQSWSSFTIF